MSGTAEPFFELPCIIFAGGKSSRMGRDKALLPFGGVPTLAQYQYDRLAPLFSAIYLSVRDTAPFPADLPTISDPPGFDGYAPTAGFVAAFRALEAERIFVISVDTPFINAPVIAALLEADRDELDAVIARTPEGIHPLCGIYRRRLLPRFDAMASSCDHKLGKMLESSHVVYVDFESEERFDNLNHPHEYDAALKKEGSRKG